jgi:chromosome segregation ATPase
MLRRLIIIFFVLLGLDSQSFADAYKTIKVIFDFKDIYDAFNNFISTETYGEQAIKDMNAGKRPQSPSPGLFMGDKLSKALDAGINAVNAVKLPEEIVDPATVPNVSSLSGLDRSSRRNALSQQVSFAVSVGQSIRDAQDGVAKLDDLSQRGEKALTAASTMATALWQISQKVPQAYVDVTGLAAADFESVYKPKISTIVTDSENKSAILKSKITSALGRLRNLTQNLSLLLSEEATDLQSAIADDGLKMQEDTSESTSSAKRIASDNNEISQLTGESNQITATWDQLQNQRDAAVQVVASFDMNSFLSANSMAELNAKWAQLGNLQAAADRATDAYWAYVNKTKGRVDAIEGRIAVLKQDMDAMQHKAQTATSDYTKLQNERNNLQIMLQQNAHDQQRLANI